MNKQKYKLTRQCCVIWSKYIVHTYKRILTNVQMKTERIYTQTHTDITIIDIIEIFKSNSLDITFHIDSLICLCLHIKMWVCVCVRNLINAQ